jgi:AcrR family transcriptional regulator
MSERRRSSLPLATPPPPPERADAARNRERVLATAARLFAEHGVEAVTMDDIVARAGVGKGTLYRRFGDKSGLARALLDDRERELQARILSGSPPLGPGSDPHERLAAFVEAYVDYVMSHLDVVAMSQTATPGARLRTGAHTFWRSHVAFLLAEAHIADREVRAEALVAAMSAEMIRHWTHDLGRSRARIVRDLKALARALIGA